MLRVIRLAVERQTAIRYIRTLYAIIESAQELPEGVNMIRLAVAGATGRTGRAVLDLAGNDKRFQVAAALTAPGRAAPGGCVRAGDRNVAVTESLETTCDVLIDFTVADGTMEWLEVCRSRGLAMLIGATGHDEEQLRRIRETASTIPVLKASNFSPGVQALLNLVGRMSKDLGAEYDVEIIEAHHRYKIDAPSGTALSLADKVANVAGSSTEDTVIFGRRGRTGERPPGQIGVHALRMGDTIGWHEIHFSGPGETITLRHTAHSRDTFAAGALRAAAWIIGKPPGYYTMADVMA